MRACKLANFTILHGNIQVQVACRHCQPSPAANHHITSHHWHHLVIHHYPYLLTYRLH